MLFIVLFTIGISSFIVWLLIAPVSIVVDTSLPSNYLRINWQGIFSFRIYNENEILHRQTSLFFFNWTQQLFGSPKRVVKKEKKRKKRKSANNKRKVYLKMIWPMLKTFTLKKFVLDVDTDNYVTNAQLIPVFAWLSRENITFSTNYMGHVRLHLIIRNRVGKILPVMLKYGFIK